MWACPCFYPDYVCCGFSGWRQWNLICPNCVAPSAVADAVDGIAVGMQEIEGGGTGGYGDGAEDKSAASAGAVVGFVGGSGGDAGVGDGVGTLASAVVVAGAVAVVCAVADGSLVVDAVFAFQICWCDSYFDACHDRAASLFRLAFAPLILALLR